MRWLALALLMFAPWSHADLANEQSLSGASDKAQAVKDEDADVLQRLYPFYFAYGSNLSKLQLSFKSPIVRHVPLYFGYTQLMFWALNANSKPFRDLTYNPELFYRWTFDSSGFLKSIDIGAFDHNSNGKAGESSRSFNQSYLRLNFEQTYADWIAAFNVKVADLYSFDPTNRDIQRYIGPLALNISITQLFHAWVDRSELALQASPGGKFATGWDYGGYQLSLAFHLGGIHLVPAFYLQYYRGFAETLLNYNERVNVFRAGIIW